MPVNRPSHSTILAAVQGEIDNQYFGTVLGTVIRKGSMMEAISKVIARASHSLFGKMEKAVLDTHPNSAVGRWLKDLGTTYNVPAREGGRANGQLRVSINATADTFIQQGDLLSSATGQLYTVDQSYSLDFSGDVGSFLIEVTADLPGTDHNWSQGDVFSYVGSGPEQITGIAAESNNNTGAQPETEDEHRDRLKDRLSEPLHGGSAFDYSRWAEEVPGVGDAWAVISPTGHVAVRIVSSNEDNLAAGLDLVNEVQEDLEGRAPETATLSVASCTITPVDIRLNIAPDTVENRALVTQAFEDMYKRYRYPGATIPQNVLTATVANLPSITSHRLDSPLGSQNYGIVGIPVLGEVSFEDFLFFFLV